MQTIIAIMLLLPDNLSAQIKAPEPQEATLRSEDLLWIDPFKRIKHPSVTRRKNQLFKQRFQTPANG